MIVWLLWWAGAFGAWLLLVGGTAMPELIFGAGASAIAAAGVWLVRRQDEVCFQLRPAFLGVLLARLPWALLRDCALVLLVVPRRLAGQHVRGHLRTVPFDPGDPSNPFDASRRALVVAGISLTPNMVVARVDADRQRLIGHELCPSPPTSDREWPL